MHARVVLIFAILLGVMGGGSADAASDLGEAVRVLPVPDGDRDPRVGLDVLALAQPDLGVDQHVVVIAVDPHHMGLDSAARQDRRDRGEVPFLRKRLDVVPDHAADAAEIGQPHRSGTP